MSRPIYTLDCETDPFEHGVEILPFLWGVWTGDEYHEFATFQEVVAFLHDKPVCVYAHNGGKFDYHFMLPALEPDRQIMVINGRIAKFKIGVCEFRDSWNILPVPLAAYKKTKVDYSIFTRANRHKPENWRVIRDYLRDDCVNLHEFVSRFIAEQGSHLTVAGAAMKHWAKTSQHKPPQSDAAYYERIKSYYYGGRVQCFKTGNLLGKFQVADINSAYPYAMLRNHPFDCEPDEIDGSALALADVEDTDMVSLRCISDGAFPLRNAGTHELTFPCGVWADYHVTGWEFRAAMELKRIKRAKLEKVYRWNRIINFDEYVYEFYNKRLHAKQMQDAAGDVIYKLFMNGLYGKFGANPANYAAYTLRDPASAFSLDNEERGTRFAGYLGPWAVEERSLEPEEMRYYNVATAASITGFVRAYLLRAIDKCSGVLYCDTDSIAARDVSALDFGKNLGQWKDEGTFRRAAIAGKKLYAFEYAEPQTDKETGAVERWKVRSKGVKLTAAQVCHIAGGGTFDYKPQAPTFRLNNPAKHGTATYVNRKVRMTSGLAK